MPARSSCAPRTPATMASRSASGRLARRRRRRETAGSGLASRLDLGEAIDSNDDVLVVAGVSLQLETDRQRACELAGLFEAVRELVEQLVRLLAGRRRRLRSALEPL